MGFLDFSLISFYLLGVFLIYFWSRDVDKTLYRIGAIHLHRVSCQIDGKSAKTQVLAATGKPAYAKPAILVSLGLHFEAVYDPRGSILELGFRFLGLV